MKISMRKCTEDDINIVYNISNDPTVRVNAFNSGFIKYKDHIEWYSKSLKNTNRIMYILEYEKTVIGQARLDKEGEKARISYSIEKNNRNKGYGSLALNLIKKEALKNRIRLIEGLVKKDNIPSRKAFIRNGFTEIEEKDFFKYIYIIKGEE